MGGFELFETAKRVIVAEYKELDLPVIETASEELDPQRYGQFDLIFSYNVMEHIPEFERSLRAQADLLSPEGVIVHNCPNYTFPYEPHFAVPVVKPLPHLTEAIFRKKLDADRPLWESLNFISCADVRSFATEHDLDVQFSPGLLYNALARLGTDPLFLDRHDGSAVVSIYKLLSKSGTISLLKHLPASIVTPMQFELRHDVA